MSEDDVTNIIIRELAFDDYDHEYMNLINHFTRNPVDISKAQFYSQVKQMDPKDYIIAVIELDEVIIATGTLLIEHKVHNNLKNMGHIEDVIVNEQYQKQGLGSKLITYLIDRAKKNNCYKVVLNCNEKSVGFYQRFGFVSKGIEMCQYL